MYQNKTDGSEGVDRTVVLALVVLVHSLVAARMVYVGPCFEGIS